MDSKAKETTEKDQVLAEVFASLGELGKKEMKDAYSHINFYKLLADDDKVRYDEINTESDVDFEPDVDYEPHEDYEPIEEPKRLTIMPALGGSIWHRMLEVSSWTIFSVINMLGLALAISARDFFETFTVLVICAGISIFVLSAAKVLLQVSRNSSYAADGAEEIMDKMKGR